MSRVGQFPKGDAEAGRRVNWRLTRRDGTFSYARSLLKLLDLQGSS
jgi:hypothetical protein